MRPNQVADFWRFVVPAGRDRCWPWQGAHSGSGYGTFKLRNRAVSAPRMAYEIVRGPIPMGLQIDHLCRNKTCVNPWHLEVVTAQENSRRANWTEECKNGHPRTPENTYVWKGTRICRPCRRVTTLAYYYRAKVNR